MAFNGTGTDLFKSTYPWILLIKSFNKFFSETETNYSQPTKTNKKFVLKLITLNCTSEDNLSFLTMKPPKQ